MTKKILSALTVIFFAGMLFLTLFAERIHNAALPQVSEAHPESRQFLHEFTDENGNYGYNFSTRLAVPEALAESGIYVIYSAEKNGTKRDYVSLAEIQTGERYDGYVEIKSGLSFSDRIVTESTRELCDGIEVYVVH